MEHAATRKCVIGFQVDNETKYFDTASLDVQRRFVKHLRRLFNGDLDALNAAYGLDYWSNRVDAWEDFPDVRGTINGSLGAEWDRFRRFLVTEFLSWQADLVREYKRDDQFITHNLDFDFGPGWSYGLQPAVDHFEVAKVLDIAGTDIYHPTEDALTGREIALGGDMTRSVKGGQNYLVLETQAQGQMGWLPYPGQLRLQALSHIASGADGVMYWHWHSSHNGFETYWKGVLSQDFEPNPTYLEAAEIGKELAEAGDHLHGIQKDNKVAILVSNESLTALDWFGIDTGFPTEVGESIRYNDVLRWVYDTLFDLNIEVDFVDAEQGDLAGYSMVVAPALYVASQQTLDKLRCYVEEGGNLVSTFRSFVTDEHVKVWPDRLPHSLTDVFGFGYDQFTRPSGVKVSLEGSLGDQVDRASGTDPDVTHFMEVLVPAEDSPVETLASYDHYAWHGPAVTRNRYGKGSATHVGAMVSQDVLAQVFQLVAGDAGVTDWAQDLAGKVSVRRGRNAAGRDLAFFFNYSKDPVTFTLPVSGANLATGEVIGEGSQVQVAGWDVLMLES